MDVCTYCMCCTCECVCACMCVYVCVHKCVRVCVYNMYMCVHVLVACILSVCPSDLVAKTLCASLV